MNNQRRKDRHRPLAQEALPAQGKRVLLAGASGIIGTAIAAQLKKRGYWVRGLTRRAGDIQADLDEIYVGDLLQSNTLDAAVDGVDLVISAAGAPPRFVGARAGRYSFRSVDDFGHRTLLNTAYAAKVRRFAYLSVFGGRFMGSEYIGSHESFVAALKMSGMRYHVVRTTPVFNAFDGMLRKARKGSLGVIGGGSALINPIHRDDLAQTFVDMIEARETEIDVGGPEVFTRREIAKMAIEAWGKEPKIRNLPLAVAAYWSRLSIFRGGHNKHVSAATTMSTQTDLVAPETGTSLLGDYFLRRVTEWSEVN